TGEGQHIEVNLLSSAMSGLVNHTAAYTATGVVPTRMGNAHPSVYPYQPFPTKDRDVIIAAANARQFRALCGVPGIGELADDDLFIALNEVGVPCGPINSIAEGVALAERLGLHPRVTLGEGERAVDLVRNPISFSAAAPTYHAPPPELGEHTDTIREWLSKP